MGGKRGRLIVDADKAIAIELIDAACSAGSRLKPACDILEISIRTLQRWKQESNLQDKRYGCSSLRANKLSPEEEAAILEVINSKEYGDKPPSQIVPILADKGIYLASESTIYRIMRKEKLLAYRHASRPKKSKKPLELVAKRPNQIWSWDITFLSSNIRGKYFYLYLFLDIFSRKIVGFNVFEEQTAEHASSVVSEAYIKEGLKPQNIILHSDNGSPMKGSTMLATLQSLGVVPSFSRPSVSDDNPFSESLFKTLKYCPNYPKKPFISIESCREWVEIFVDWYNNTHHHSGIKFVTPQVRHEGKDKEILQNRKKIYESARARTPSRWSKNIRNFSYISTVYLKPKHKDQKTA